MAGAQAYVTAADARGQLLGSWTTDIGTLGRLFVLRGFSDAAELAAERKRALFSANPFGAADVLTGLETESYAPFPRQSFIALRNSINAPSNAECL